MICREDQKFLTEIEHFLIFKINDLCTIKKYEKENRERKKSALLPALYKVSSTESEPPP